MGFSCWSATSRRRLGGTTTAASPRNARDFYLDSMAQVRLDRWSRGRVVQLGDTGYCPTSLTGLGTSLALVGAYILASELAAIVDDTSAVAEEHAIHNAFDRYDTRIRPYVEQSQELPPGGVLGTPRRAPDASHWAGPRCGGRSAGR
jgi:2-polyprenyl-6-methoxyphenol hydroxylase-like FAD-dependent oxidoreductase